MGKKVLALCFILVILILFSGAYVIGGTQAYTRFQQSALAAQHYCREQAPVHICVSTPKAIFSAFYPSYVTTHTPLFIVEYSSTHTLPLSISVGITGFSQVETHPVKAIASVQQQYFVPRILQTNATTVLNGLTREMPTFLHVQVSDGNKHNYYTNDIPLLVHSRWLMEWTKANRLQIAAWVTPDDRMVMALVARATNLLSKQLPPAPVGMVAYGATTTRQIQDQVDAIYDALRLENMHYVNTTVPYTGADSDAVATQKVQLPSEVLKQHSGMCIELTALLASAVENIGLHTEIVIIPGHAFLGVATTTNQTHFEYWDAVDVDNHVAGDSANAAGDALYAKNVQQHTVLDTIAISEARIAGVGPML